jgi:3-mercaptopyruvate sulfurtransferase SseA
MAAAAFSRAHASCRRWSAGPARRPCGRAAAALLRAPDAVVSTSWLQQHLQDVSVIDVRGTADVGQQGVQQSSYVAEYGAYLEGHVPVGGGCHACCRAPCSRPPAARLQRPRSTTRPLARRRVQGAVFLDWTRDGVDADDPVPVQLLADSGAFAAALEAKGVGSDRPVVVRRRGPRARRRRAAAVPPASPPRGQGRRAMRPRA